MSTAVGGWLEGLKRRLTSLWKIQCPKLIVLAEREMLRQRCHQAIISKSVHIFAAGLIFSPLWPLTPDQPKHDTITLPLAAFLPPNYLRLLE